MNNGKILAEPSVGWNTDIRVLLLTGIVSESAHGGGTQEDRNTLLLFQQALKFLAELELSMEKYYFTLFFE